MNCCLHVKSTIVPDETVGSCLDPGLPRASLQGGGGIGHGARPAQFRGKESVRTQQRWERHDKGQGKMHSGPDAGGSAANRVRGLSVHYITLLVSDS
jgi:hypothetical protein